MFMLMLFMFFFFLGSIFMFLYVLKKMDRQETTLSEEHAQLRVLLRALESRLEKISQMERLNAIMQGHLNAESIFPDKNQDSDGSEKQDPLLHLSFEKPGNIEGTVDPGLRLDLDEGNWDMGDSRKD